MNWHINAHQSAFLFPAGSGNSLVQLGEHNGLCLSIHCVILNICSVGRKLTTSYHILMGKSTHNISSVFSEKDKDLDKIVEGNFMFIFIVMLENGPKCEWHNYRTIYLNWGLIQKKCDHTILKIAGSIVQIGQSNEPVS